MGAPGTGPLLVLNGVSSRLSVTLGRVGTPPVCRSCDAVGRSAEVLAPLVAEALAEAGIAARELGGVACVRGPGSFTGIRVTLATAVGLACGAGVPMAGLDCLPLLAASAAGRVTGVIVAVTHARSSQVYLQSFLADGDVMPMGPPAALFLPDAAARLAEAAAVGPVGLVGYGAGRHRDVLAAAAPLAAFLGPEFDHPDPAVLLAAAALADYGPRPVEPLYLRPSDAEENLAALVAGRGLAPAAAADIFRRATSDV